MSNLFKDMGVSGGSMYYNSKYIYNIMFGKILVDIVYSDDLNKVKEYCNKLNNGHNEQLYHYKETYIREI